MLLVGRIVAKTTTWSYCTASLAKRGRNLDGVVCLTACLVHGLAIRKFQLRAQVVWFTPGYPGAPRGYPWVPRGYQRVHRVFLWGALGIPGYPHDTPGYPGVSLGIPGYPGVCLATLEYLGAATVYKGEPRSTMRYPASDVSPLADEM
jgi:hypothetical protein